MNVGSETVECIKHIPMVEAQAATQCLIDNITEQQKITFDKDSDN
jgi:hypothetical protein